MTLKDLLITIPLREDSGSRSSNRFDFQKSWALCKLLDLHRTEKDYLIVFDFHDDVLVLDSAKSPNAIDFFQIKTSKQKPWSRKALLHRKKVKGYPSRSILGKLVGNKINFPVHARTLNLVSNQAFKLTLRSTAKGGERICLADLAEPELQAIQKALNNEHSTSLIYADCTYLEVTPLSLTDHDTHAVGKLTRFLDQRHPGQKFPVPAVYRALCDEIKRRTNTETVLANFDQLSERKAISHAAFSEFLGNVRPSDEFDGFVVDATDYLRKEGMAFEQLKAFRDACSQFEIERMDASNTILRRTWKQIARSIADMRQKMSMPTELLKQVAAVEVGMVSGAKEIRNMKSPAYLQAMIVMALYGI